MMQALHNEIRTHAGDLPNSALAKAREAGLIGWDIETSGLDWCRDRIGTCQVFIPTFDVFVVQISGSTSRHPNLESLLCNSQVRKVFHHAIFDLRFMLHHWGVTINNVVCTKIASKILNPSDEDHTLKSVLQKHLGIHIEKDLGNSDWLRSRLTDEQVHYAVQDVVHLPDLLDKLQSSLEAVDRWHLAQESFAYLPTRATLDILGAGDVFRYE
jgi:ribonuclease D